MPGPSSFSRRPAPSTAGRLRSAIEGGRHSWATSLALHLLPGVPIVLAYLLLTGPLVRAIGYPPFLAWVLAMCLGLVPVQLGTLFWLGARPGGRRSLRGVVAYADRPIRRWPLVGVVTGLVLWTFVAGSVAQPVDRVLQERVFAWLPWASEVSGTTGAFTGHAESKVVTTLAVSLILSGVLGPVTEELYFRGFLLPRLPAGRWAPAVNTALFSLYHFWTPWQFFSRVLLFLPAVWCTWRGRDLRVSLWVHVIGNTTGQLLGLIAVTAGLASG
ncbi:CPBP family intramembrane glutamic endopeptidase [Planomonospora sp. ID82291]|uniref:CPBP family intramembrane glutamic endopeptidase n=1 Tax=Planomonospora sp. ID82291 TaxID=2738136 RepID=UPI0018C3C0FC|nr:CPBP family intramembrane glutamic endopeptidase [Planomonospora sp. ID82291]MBG0817918.1 CPBP family intramembrane metalloprotease [Planomonospora sp. ID82291]